MIFDWFDAGDATRFGVFLAEFLSERVPLEGEAAARSKSAKKQNEAFPKLLVQIAQFKCEHKLNMYKRAKLANAFKWRLLDIGYDPDFVDAATKKLLLNI